MNITEMIISAEEALSQNMRMSLVVPRPFKNRPKGFPKGELLCEQERSNVVSYDPVKILTWLKKNGLYDGQV